MKTKTFSEVNGKKPFDWNEFLNREYRSNQEWIEAIDLADDWVTCACGNQCDVIPRVDGRPLDDELSSLGVIFSTLVRSRDIKRSLEALYWIEKRTAELLEEL